VQLMPVVECISKKKFLLSYTHWWSRRGRRYSVLLFSRERNKFHIIGCIVNMVGGGNTERSRRDVQGKRPLLPPGPMPVHQPSSTSSICSMYSPSTRFISLSSVAYLGKLVIKHTQDTAYILHSHIVRVLPLAQLKEPEVQLRALALALARIARDQR